MNLTSVLHILRNPQGFDEGTVRRARLNAANEIERLQAVIERYHARGKYLAGYQPLPDRTTGAPVPPRDE